MVSSLVGHNDNKAHPVNCFFDTDAGPNPTLEDFLETERLKAIQTKNQGALKNVTG